MLYSQLCDACRYILFHLARAGIHSAKSMLCYVERPPSYDLTCPSCFVFTGPTERKFLVFKIINRNTP